MDRTLPTWLEPLWSSNRAQQNEAFAVALAATAQPVDWAYSVWDQVVAHLTHTNNHNRAIAAQLLCRLAKSNPEQRILHDFVALLAVTKDERFVTARHCLQALWQIGTAGDAQQAHLLAGLEVRFVECHSEKNWSLIRYDIIASLRKLYAATAAPAVKAKALALIDLETDAKYRKKYATLWRGQ